MEGKSKKKSVNPYILVIISFATVILVGALLLCMPWANTYGKWLWRYDTGEQVITFLDCLFTAVSATCVTGLQPFARPIGETLTFGGQLVLLIMIQIGGLGFITILTFVITLFKHRLEFRNRYFVSQMVNSTNFADVIAFVRKIGSDRTEPIGPGRIGSRRTSTRQQKSQNGLSRRYLSAA